MTCNESLTSGRLHKKANPDHDVENHYQADSVDKHIAENIDIKKLKAARAQRDFSLLLALLFFIGIFVAILIQIPLPNTFMKYGWPFSVGLFALILLMQNMFDGALIRTIRLAKMKTHTVLFIVRNDGRMGWISQRPRGGSITSDIYGEYGITPNSCSYADGVPIGFADESEGLTLPLKLARIAQDLNFEWNIKDWGTLDSVINCESKIGDYEQQLAGFKNRLSVERNNLKPLELESLEAAIEKTTAVLEYLNKIKLEYDELIQFHKQTLVLEPFLRFFSKIANNPQYKRNTRERALSLEKAKTNKGQDTRQNIFYFCMLVLAIGFAIYLINTGAAGSAGDALTSAVNPVGQNVR